MECVILKSSRYVGNQKDFWPAMKEHLARRKVEVLEQPVDADMSIVLSGKYENPALLKGKKVLAFKPQEWFNVVPPPKGWAVYEPLLKYYYDDFIDLSGLNPKKAAKRIIEYIDEAKKS